MGFCRVLSGRGGNHLPLSKQLFMNLLFLILLLVTRGTFAAENSFNEKFDLFRTTSLWKQGITNQRPNEFLQVVDLTVAVPGATSNNPPRSVSSYIPRVFAVSLNRVRQITIGSPPIDAMAPINRRTNSVNLILVEGPNGMDFVRTCGCRVWPTCSLSRISLTNQGHTSINEFRLDRGYRLNLGIEQFVAPNPIR